jgi:pimeloyl-ACP methyl ester carboxylesterase
LLRFGISSPERLTDEMYSVIATCAQQYGASHAILGLFSGNFSFPLLPRLSGILHPVTLLWPERSTLFPFEYVEKMANLLPRSNLRLVPYRGVLAPLEDPEGFQKLIEETLLGEGEL